MPRIKGKAAEKEPAPIAQAPRIDSTPVPTESDSSPALSVSLEKKSKRASAKKKAASRESTHKTDDGKPYVRGHAAIKAYWEELGLHAGADVNIEELKKAIRNLRQVAIAQLKTTGNFRLYGICEMRIRSLKGRPSKKSKCFGNEITMKEKPPSKRVYAKCVKELSDACVKEQNA